MIAAGTDKPVAHEKRERGFWTDQCSRDSEEARRLIGGRVTGHCVEGPPSLVGSCAASAAWPVPAALSAPAPGGTEPQIVRDHADQGPGTTLAQAVQR